MNGIQSFYVGGQAAGGFRFTDKGKNVSTANQRVPNTPEKSKEEQQKNIGKIMKDMRDNRKSDRMEYQRQVGQDKNFVEDLKKLIGPQGSGTFLFTQNPNTKAFMDKYGLDTQDIIDLRLGATQRGFQGNIRKVGEKALGNLRLSKNLFDPMQAIRLFKEGMSPKDVLPSRRGGVMGFVENAFNAGPFAGFGRMLAGGSPQGVAGLFYGNQMGLTPEQTQQLGAVSANYPEIYDSLMSTPQLMQRGVDEFSYNTQRGLPTRGGNRTPEPTPDPITAAYNPSMNPFLNQGIQPFSYMV